MERFFVRPFRFDGYTLIEVLIAMILMAISMLGLASMHSHSNRSNYQAHFQTQSVSQAIDIVERMRLNPIGVERNFYTQSLIPSSHYKDCSVPRQVCSAQELATFDLVQWNRVNALRLPGGSGSVSSIGGGTGNVFQVSVYWQSQGAGKDGADDNPSCDTTGKELRRCYAMVVRL